MNFLTAAVFSLLVIFLKRPDAFLNPQFYAEDGKIFFAGAYQHGAASLLEPYAGYLHTFPRLWALLFFALHLPYEDAPLFFNLGWLAAFLGLLAYLWMRLPYTAPVKWLMSVCTVMLPFQAVILMNLTFSPWILAPGLFIALFSAPPRSSKEFACDAAVVFLSGLSGPFIVFLFPVYAAAFAAGFKDQGRRGKMLAGFAAGITLLHAAALIIHAGKRQVLGMAPSPFTWKQMAAAIYAFPAYLLAGRQIFYTSNASRVLLSVFFAAAGAVFGYVSFKERKQNAFRFLCLLGGLVLFAGTLAYFRNYLPVTYPFVAPHYEFIPAVVLVWGLLASMRPGRIHYLFAGLLLAHFALQSVTGVPPYRLKDKNWKMYAQKIEARPDAAYTVPLNPDSWSMYLEAKK